LFRILTISCKAGINTIFDVQKEFYFAKH